MGCVQQAVLEFDEEVRAPWRPRLVAVPAFDDPSIEPESAVAEPGPPSRRNPSRVGACRPSETVVAGAARAPSRAVPEGGRAGAPGARLPYASPVAGRQRPRSRVRLTRRARRFALVLALAAGVALGSWLGSSFGPGGGSGLRLTGETSVVVQPGDTLWSIAGPAAGDGDVRTEIAEVRRINGLTSARLVPGQRLRLP